MINLKLTRRVDNETINITINKTKQQFIDFKKGSKKDQPFFCSHTMCSDCQLADNKKGCIIAKKLEGEEKATVVNDITKISLINKSTKKTVESEKIKVSDCVRFVKEGIVTNVDNYKIQIRVAGCFISVKKEDVTLLYKGNGKIYFDTFYSFNKKAKIGDIITSEAFNEKFEVVHKTNDAICVYNRSNKVYKTIDSKNYTIYRLLAKRA